MPVMVTQVSGDVVRLVSIVLKAGRKRVSIYQDRHRRAIGEIEQETAED
jgi:hypothetical protein